MSVRDQLAAALKPLLPKRWKLIPYQDSLDEISQTTVMFKLMKMENLKQAPLSHYSFTFLLTVIEPGSDMQKVETALDDHVEDLWQLLDMGLSWTAPQEATKVFYGSSNLAYDITTEVVCPKPTQPTE